ncbi:hypothetical protein [Corynebacterium variabile]|uniref:hypothetical protein n=1 Tax=Corynebacterium variabile TaxID=1727 RepID=UPI0028ADDBDA|nr:hypothetical protein [Corynebacterium variabile]
MVNFVYRNLFGFRWSEAFTAVSSVYMGIAILGLTAIALVLASHPSLARSDLSRYGSRVAAGAALMVMIMLYSSGWTVEPLSEGRAPLWTLAVPGIMLLPAVFGLRSAWRDYFS